MEFIAQKSPEYDEGEQRQKLDKRSKESNDEVDEPEHPIKVDKKAKNSFAKCEELKELSDENKMTVKTPMYECNEQTVNEGDSTRSNLNEKENQESDVDWLSDDTASIDYTDKDDDQSKSDDEYDSCEYDSEYSDSDTGSESEFDDKICPPETEDEITLSEKARLRIKNRHEEAEKQRSTNKLRCPIICVFGHVNTGTKEILVNLRRSNVQGHESDGTIHQFGVSDVSKDTIADRTKMCRYLYKNLMKIPGLLIIDTPSHKSIESLRTKGSSLCDLAILVVDIMQGLDRKTIESINILKDKKTPFIVALNQIDRISDWKAMPDKDIVKVLESQASVTQIEFESRTNKVLLQLVDQGVNAQLFFKKHDTAPCISIVPTSSLTSDGIGNLMALVVELSQTNLSDRISYSTELQCVVMGVEAISGIGTTIDVCLVNGKLSIDDTIIIAGQKGPIVTKVSDLLTTRPNRVPRGKNSFVQNKQVVGTCIVKIKADNLEKSLGGLPLYVAEEKCEIELYKKEMAKMLEQSLKSMKLQEIGVFVHAPTLGKLESFLKYLRAIKLPVAGINVGPVQRLDVAKAAFMASKNSLFSYILALDVKVEPDARDYADNENFEITIYSEKYIYIYKFHVMGIKRCIKHNLLQMAKKFN